MSETRGDKTRGITHQMEVGGKRLLVTVCHDCEINDFSLRRGWPGNRYLGVMNPPHRIDECHHPHHGRDA